jgi:hypothetical protein
VSTIANAWKAFLAAIAEVMSLQASGGDPAAIQDLLQHARELLDIIEDEIAAGGQDVPEEARAGLQQLRARLVAVETSLVTKN